MSPRSSLPTYVVCVCCGQTRLAGSQARELVFEWSAHKGGTNGDVKMTTTAVWACKQCAPWNGAFPKTTTPHEPLLVFIRQYLAKKRDQQATLHGVA